MSLTLGDNFSYQGAKPLDARLKYDTLANMKAVADATMYDGCIAYCAETDKTYQWLAANTVDTDTGKWREFSSGGGSTIQVDTMPTATATELGNIYQYVGTTTNDYINGCFYECVTDGSTYSWENKSTLPPLSSGGMADIVNPLPTTYHGSFGFTPVGTVIAVMGNSAPLHYLACNGQVVNIADYPELANYFYQQFGSKNKFGGDGTTTFGIPDLRGEFLRGTGTNSHANQGSGANVGVHQDATNVWFSKSSNIASPNQDILFNKDSEITGLSRNLVNKTTTDDNGWCYTVRPTNTSVLYCIATKNIYLNPSLDYSTYEKVVGTWIDGKPLYQKTIIPSTTTPLPNKGILSIPTGLTAGTIDTLVKLEGMIKENVSLHQWRTLPMIQDNNSILNIGSQLYEENGIIYYCILARSADLSVYDFKHAIIQYTKTTD